MFRAQLRQIAARANELDPVGSACRVVTELDGTATPAGPRTRRRN